MLGRLRIRSKLTILVMVPMLVLAYFAAPFIGDRFAVADKARRTAQAVQLASRSSVLLQALQRERLISAGFLVGAVERSELVQQTAVVGDQVTTLAVSGILPRPFLEALGVVNGLAPLRAQVLAGHTSLKQVVDDFSGAIARVINAIGLTDVADLTKEEGRQIVGLDALIRSDEAQARSAAMGVAIPGREGAPSWVQAINSRVEYNLEQDRFHQFATADQARLYGLIQSALDARGINRLINAILAQDAASFRAVSAAERLQLGDAISGLGALVEKRIATEVFQVADDLETTNLASAYTGGALGILVLLLVLLLSAAVARAVARPLVLLTASADRVARAAEAELVRIADEDVDHFQPMALEPVSIPGRDEISDLSRAFDRVQVTAARLVERQVFSQRNIAHMFGNVGRRTQNLVGRQLGVIDRLEREETDPSRLETLYQLDHVSSRLRRNAGSLVVLSGSAGAGDHHEPVSLEDVVRLALAEIEDYLRVDIAVADDLKLVPHLVGDVVLVLAELMENATTFSPPDTRVMVTSTVHAAGCVIAVVDHGIGMSPERLAEENARLTRRERLDLAPSDVLGLFVVGRLTRRHGLGVMLSATHGAGITAELSLPAEQLLVTGSSPMRPPTLLGPGGFSAGQPASAPLLDVLALARASKALESAETWDGFSMRHKLPMQQAASQRVTPAHHPSSQPEPIRPAANVRALPGGAAAPVVATPERPVRPATPIAPSAPAAREVRPQMPPAPRPATQLPPAAPVTRVPAAAPPTRPAAPAARTSPAPPTRPAAPAARTSPAPPTRPAVPAARAAAPSAPTAPPAGTGQAAPGNGARTPGLVRRVPGATLRTDAPPAPTPASPAAAERAVDPDAARALVEQFEFGVAKAMSEIGTAPSNDGAAEPGGTGR
ncbi:MAG: nitrate- and nitrite sensing domain-containing protein [Actinobacteria bacterium]|nr:nitrate- and nitrite sensing domain-containing protein [Actinomycetota bacterium]MBI3688824.1 nitrate- and nitrite sensing domain-containing protein [Actinomycetota bacterium]